jgi:transmembrane sensor
MTTPPGFDDPRLQRMEQAALWLQRLRAEGDDNRVVEAWLEWCQRDPVNQQAFDEIAAVWDVCGRLSSEPRPAAVAAPTRRRRWALAASLVAGLGLAAVAGSWWATRPQPVEVLTSEFSSPIGINSTQRLADGSVLELGGGTRVTVSIGPRERRVQLHAGELYVAVHHEPDRPFLVAAERLEILATGTAFDVLRTNERTIVTVAEGSVAARYDGQRVELPGTLLRAGQQLIHALGSRHMDLRAVEPDKVTMWRSGMLQFDREPLSEVIASINRYSARPILIEDPRVGAFILTTGARVDGISDWLKSLPEMDDFPFPVTVVELADGSHLIGPRTVRPD